MLSQTESILKRDERFLQAAYEDFQAMCNEETDCKEYHEMLQRLQYSMDKLNKVWNDFVSLNTEIKQVDCNEDIVKPDRYCGKDGKDLCWCACAGCQGGVSGDSQKPALVVGSRLCRTVGKDRQLRDS